MKHPRRMPLLTTLLRGCLFLLLSVSAFSQRTENSIAISCGYNDDGQIFLSPQSSDPAQRQLTQSVDGAFGFSAGWRYRLFPTLAMDLRGEYISQVDEEADAVGTAFRHGFQVLLIQASALFSLPFSTERFEMHVGGGVGVYSGRRVYSIAGINAEHVSSAPAFGIHVLIGAEYLVLDRLGLRFETIFRDPQMGVNNRFPYSPILSHGVNYNLQTEAFRSNLNLNGNLYSLGLSWYF